MRPVVWTHLRRSPSALLFGKNAPAESSSVIRRRCMLVDGNNVLYHYYDPTCTVERDGVKTGAIERMLHLLHRLHHEHQPEHICVFFDQPRQKTVRHAIDPLYKSTRRPTPHDLRGQLTAAQKWLTASNVNCISLAGIEADDLIASYTEQFHAQDVDVLVVSNDNDFLQLIRDGAHNSAVAGGDGNAAADGNGSSSSGDSGATTATVVIYQLSKRRYIRDRNVRSRFGVAPWQLPSLFALCGQSWGKLPRVAGVTDGLAMELLTTHGSLPRLLRNLDSLTDPVLRRTLKQEISAIETSYRIAKLNGALPLPTPISELIVGPTFESVNRLD